MVHKATHVCLIVADVVLQWTLCSEMCIVVCCLLLRSFHVVCKAVTRLTRAWSDVETRLGMTQTGRRVTQRLVCYVAFTASEEVFMCISDAVDSTSEAHGGSKPSVSLCNSALVTVIGYTVLCSVSEVYTRT